MTGVRSTCSTRWRRRSACCCASGRRPERPCCEATSRRGRSTTSASSRSRWRSSRSARSALTAFNVDAARRARRSSAATLTARIATRRRRSARGSARRRRACSSSVDPARTLESLGGLDAAKPTTLIDQRTFSWTAFFGLDREDAAARRAAHRRVAARREGRLQGHDDRRRQDAPSDLDDVHRRARRTTGAFYDVAAERDPGRTTTARSARRSSRAYLTPPNAAPKPAEAGGAGDGRQGRP